MKKFNLSRDEIIKLHRGMERSLTAHSDEALIQFCRLAVDDPIASNILDIGSGSGKHMRLIESCGLNVETIDLNPKRAATYTGDYLAYMMPKQYDGVWCAHTLEHQPNVNLFLRKIHRDLKEGGILAITVPPHGVKEPADRIVGGHLTLWNAGLLLYNLILANYDCSNAMVRTYGYNVSVIVKKKTIVLPSDLAMDKGDIERLTEFFPLDARQGFDGNIQSLNWPALPFKLPSLV